MVVVFHSGGAIVTRVIVGPLQILVADGPDGTSSLIHRVVVDGQAVQLDFADANPDLGPDFGPGSVVAVGGQRRVRHVLGRRGGPAVAAAPYAPRKLAVILIDWGSDPEVSPSEADDKISKRTWARRWTHHARSSCR